MSWTVLFVSLVLLLTLVLPVWNAMRRRRVERTGRIANAKIVRIADGFGSTGHQPNMRYTLAVDQPDGSVQEVLWKETLDPAQPRKVGDPILVVVDSTNPTRVYPADRNAMRRKDAAGARLRTLATIPAPYQGTRLYVGDIAQITPLPGGESSVLVNVVRIGSKPQPVFCTQAFSSDKEFAVGDRVFLHLDQENPPCTGFILSAELTGGEKIARTGNRLDGNILARDILFDGAEASGTVYRAEEQSLPAEYRRTQVSKWQIFMHIVPQDGSAAAYDGSMMIAVSTTAKAAQINAFGTVLPVRYDPNDPPTLSIDTVALGWGDPSIAEAEIKRIAHSIGRT